MGRSYYTLSLDYQYGIPRDHPTKLERYREISMALRKDDTHKSRSVTCPCGLHSVISRLLAGGALVSALPLLLHGSQITVWQFCGVVVPRLFSIAIPIPEVIQCYHLF